MQLRWIVAALLALATPAFAQAPGKPLRMMFHIADRRQPRRGDRHVVKDTKISVE